MMNTAHKILVVDDDPDILDAVKLMLEYAQYEVEISEKAECVEKLRKGNLPSLILLDVLLSGKDGRELCKLLKSKKDTKHIPIIMISAHPNLKNSVKECGAQDFLAKPFEMDELLAKVAHLLKGD